MLQASRVRRVMMPESSGMLHGAEVMGPSTTVTVLPVRVTVSPAWAKDVSRALAKT